jgi:hypothetical protein
MPHGVTKTANWGSKIRNSRELVPEAGLADHPFVICDVLDLPNVPDRASAVPPAGFRRHVRRERSNARGTRQDHKTSTDKQ